MSVKTQDKIFRAVVVLGLCFHLRATKIRLNWHDKRFFLQIVIQRSFLKSFEMQSKTFNYSVTQLEMSLAC